MLGQIVGQKLQGHEAAQFSVLGLIDHAHAATTKLLDDAVVRDGLADHQRMPGFRVAPSYGREMRESTTDRGIGAGGWPTFTFFVKVGTHAAGVGIFILASPH